MMDKKKLNALVISHSHWDRAWYLPFQTFRIRLVRLIDRILETLENDPDFTSFLLDGQMLPVEDYLEIRPDHKESIKKLIQDERLFVGPWYALADEFLVSPEALIRNLMLGIRLAEDLGGATRVGYIPDSFGHIAQLPQILAGFGIDSAVFWRGLGDEGEKLGDEFFWQAPNGSQVLTIHMRKGYFNASNLGFPIYWGDTSALEFDLDLAIERLEQAVEDLQPSNRSGLFLLMNGIDHADIDPKIPQILQHANQKSAKVQYCQSNLPDYLDQVRAATGDDLAIYTGEMVGSRYGFGVRGVYSSRMYLQQANQWSQTILESFAEPISTWAWLLGHSYPGPFLDLAWRKLIQNHPHDDICGCSVDQVHRENMVVFDQVAQIAHPIIRDGFRALCSKIDRSAAGEPFVFYNPSAAPRTQTSLVELDFQLDDPLADNFHLVDSTGARAACQILGSRVIQDPELGKTDLITRVTAAVYLRDLPPCGYRVYYALPGQSEEYTPLDQPLIDLKNGMENEYLKVEIQTDGSLNVLDKQTGQSYQHLNFFVDQEDAGDEYDYSPAPNPESYSTLGSQAEIECIIAGPLLVRYRISHEFELPRSLTEDRQKRSPEKVVNKITSEISLGYQNPFLDVKTMVANESRDHRLRACFPTSIDTEYVAADSHFDVMKRPLRFEEKKNWDQPDVPTRHQRYFVDLSDGKAGLAVLNRGLAEYEILQEDKQNTIAITLLRCVGYLTRGDLQTRPGGQAGPPEIETPDAQCLGISSFEYRIAPHPDDWTAIYDLAYHFRAPVYVRRGLDPEGALPALDADQSPDRLKFKPRVREGELPGEGSFLDIQPSDIKLSAVKRAEDGKRVIIRVYNPTSGRHEGEIHFFCPVSAAWETDLNEESIRSLQVENYTTIRLDIKPKEIKTIALVIDAGESTNLKFLSLKR